MNPRYEVDLYKATPWTTQFNGQPRWDGTQLKVYDGATEIVIGPNSNNQLGYMLSGTYSGDGSFSRVIAPGVAPGGRIEFVITGANTNTTSSTQAYATRTFTMPRAHVLHSTSVVTGTIVGFTSTTFTVSASDGIVNYVGFTFHYMVWYTIP